MIKGHAQPQPAPVALDDEARWRAALSRDARFDGAFVFGVRSTGVYCRPSCPARRPRRETVLFFPLPEAAEGAGFRSCRRCRPQEASARDPRAAWLQRLCRRIESQLGEGPRLSALAREAGMSPHHFQRTFKRLMGLTPRQYAEAARLRAFKDQLHKGETVTEALYDAGYGSSSRLYERASARLGMTPATYQQGGRGARMSFAIVACPLGRLLLAATERGLAAVRLGDSDEELETGLRQEYPAAEIRRDDARVGALAEALLRHLDGQQPVLDLPLDVKATAFQWRVWEALRAIPYGQTRSYGEIARDLGLPSGARAVARACATNPVAIAIPCHRVVREGGGLGGYRWGLERKEALLARERNEEKQEDRSESS